MTLCLLTVLAQLTFSSSGATSVVFDPTLARVAFDEGGYVVVRQATGGPSFRLGPGSGGLARPLFWGDGTLIYRSKSGQAPWGWTIYNLGSKSKTPGDPRLRPLCAIKDRILCMDAVDRLCLAGLDGRLHKVLGTPGDMLRSAPGVLGAVSCGPPLCSADGSVVVLPVTCTAQQKTSIYGIVLRQEGKELRLVGHLEGSAFAVAPDGSGVAFLEPALARISWLDRVGNRRAVGQVRHQTATTESTLLISEDARHILRYNPEGDEVLEILATVGPAASQTTIKLRGAPLAFRVVGSTLRYTYVSRTKRGGRVTVTLEREGVSIAGG